MTRSRGLPLRTRLLVLQIVVTAVFLLVMGIVSTLLFATNLTSQFDNILLAESAQSPNDLVNNPTNDKDVCAVLVTFTPKTVLPLQTGTPALTRALAAAVSHLSPARLHLLGSHDQLFSVQPPGHGAPALRAAARQISPTGSLQRTSDVLIVAERASVVHNQLRGLILKELITGGGLLALLAIGGQWLIGRGLGQLDRMARTANDITTRGDLTARMTEADDQTEVGRLGAAINTMLDRIQQAFGARLSSERKVREFAADASHELRTPLTTIRGYAELYRQGALGPDQLPRAMRRIEQEAQRMSTLVAELLELARLDRTSSLDLTETDLATVVRDAVADATAVEPDRPISAQAPPRLIAVVDERRIRQVLANLLGNVRAHTPRSTPVAVRLGSVQGGVLIEVADAGHGMSQEDAARAFDRFHRASERGGGSPDPGDGAWQAHANGGAGSVASGSEGPGGEGPPGVEFGGGAGSGLGLSIVQAIATAHGGQATLESWPRHGTRVRIWLPARAAPSVP